MVVNTAESKKQVYILETKTQHWAEAEIVEGTYQTMPLKKNNWQFAWRKAIKEENATVYLLRLVANPAVVQGAMQLKLTLQKGILWINLLEVAPWNLGKQHKQYEHVAGCLIAFACKQAFRLESSYKGYLLFQSKVDLIDFYKEKYGASVLYGKIMVLSPATGMALIEQYLKTSKNDFKP